MFKFYVGLSEPAHAKHFERSFISVNRLKRRKAKFICKDWIIDSGAFTEISTHGTYRSSVKDYADEVNRWLDVGNLISVVSQDWMCEPFILNKTGLTLHDHQQLTIERYVELLNHLPNSLVMPVLQGFSDESYLDHIDQYGTLLAQGMYVGVGSVCKRNNNPSKVFNILSSIKASRPDLRLHGFGLKLTALKEPKIVELLESSDSMAWSYNRRRREPGAQNNWQSAKDYETKILEILA